MSFEDRPFILLLLATYCLWLLVRHRERAAVGLLLTASLLFYGYNHWTLLPILLAYCVIDWGIALQLERSRRTRTLLAIGVTFNLLVLCFYKYTPLVVATIASDFGIKLLPESTITADHWAIPFGISFYAFTGIAYMVDVARQTTPAERSLLRYTLSATFFPHLVAGPILRPNEFLTSLRPGQMPQEPQAPLEACWLLARGYFKKMVIANRIGLAIDPFFAHVNDPATAGVWSLPYVYLYALEIYFDFSAYTDIARGIGLLFGYRWPDNFNLPYLATSVADFWRRWHITLSRFLRDYLYIPLGGNRCGVVRTNLNLMLTMLLGGLWHGASWSFLVWGGLHGGFLVIHRAWAALALRERLARLTGMAGAIWQAACILLTFHCVCLAWCFFRLTVFGDSLACVRKWFAFDADKVWVGQVADVSLWVVIAGYAAIVGMSKIIALWWNAERSRSETPAPALALGMQWGFRVAVLCLAALLSPAGAAPPFIYFQF
jgi:D-alanyl-lipoteichoic acid acyltransferase DltB (MBOAT superfamily)